MRQVKTSLDAATRKIRTTNSLSRTTAEQDILETFTDTRLPQVLRQERRRVAAYQASIGKSRERVLRSRAKLATLLNTNRALTRLRHELQSRQWDESIPAPVETKTPPARRGPTPVEIEY